MASSYNKSPKVIVTVVDLTGTPVVKSTTIPTITIVLTPAPAPGPVPVPNIPNPPTSVIATLI